MPNRFMTMYDSAAVERERSRLEKSMRQLQNIILQNGPSDARVQLAAIKLEFPTQAPHDDPLDFFASRGIVVLPLASLQFIEDLATAYAWLASYGPRLESVQDYLTLLRYRTPVEFPGRRWPSPLKALDVPNNAWSDKKIDVLSLRFRNTAFAFILGHEIAHLYYRHPSYAPGRGSAQTRANEQQADVFALEIMRQAATIPFGAMLYFLAFAYYTPVRADFDTEEKWKAFVDSSTHPLTSQRLFAAAHWMQENARHITRIQPSDVDVCLQIASWFNEIGEFLDDMTVQKELRRRALAHSFRVSDD